MTDIFYTLGCRISDFRRLNGFTQKVFAELVGVSPGFVSKVERGIKRPTMYTVYRMAEALGVPISWLFKESANPGSRAEAYLIDTAQLPRSIRLKWMRDITDLFEEMCVRVKAVSEVFQETFPKGLTNTSFWKIPFTLFLIEALLEIEPDLFSDKKAEGK